MLYRKSDILDYSGSFPAKKHGIQALPLTHKIVFVTFFLKIAPQYLLNDTTKSADIVPSGGVILIHGEVVHRSAENTSEDSRHVYTFHIMESQDTQWSPDNW